MGVRGGRWLSVVVLDTEPPVVVVGPGVGLGGRSWFGGEWLTQVVCLPWRDP